MSAFMLGVATTLVALRAAYILLAWVLGGGGWRWTWAWVRPWLEVALAAAGLLWWALR